MVAQQNQRLARVEAATLVDIPALVLVAMWRLCATCLPCFLVARLLAFLREEEERERLEEIERLRPVGTAVGPYMEYR